MGRLTTHILDIAHGCPGAGISIDLYSVGNDRTRLAQTVTNADGRCDSPLLEGDQFAAGTYELVFHAGDYFTRKGVELPQPRFLDQVVVRFGIASADEHYHVPLVLSPFAYSTYRGS